MGAFVVIVGLLVALRRSRGGGTWQRPTTRRRSLAVGAALVVLGAVGYKIATGVVIPHFSGGVGFVYWTFPALGPDPATAARFALTHPWAVLQLMVSPWQKAHTLLLLGLPTLYLCVLSPYVLLTAPFIAQRMLNSRELLWSTNFHYSSVLAPILVMAAVDSLDRVLVVARRRWAGPRSERVRSLVRDGWIVCAVAVVVVGMAVQAGDYPVSRIWTGRFWAQDSRVTAIEATLPLIPRNVCIESDNTIAPHLTGIDYVTRVARSNGLATWMVLDFSRGDTGWEGTTPATAYDRALAGGFTVVSQKGVIVLLTRPGAAVAPVCTVTTS
jgi:hypothetical protein